MQAGVWQRDSTAPALAPLTRSQTPEHFLIIFFTTVWWGLKGKERKLLELWEWECQKYSPYSHWGQQEKNGPKLPEEFCLICINFRTQASEGDQKMSPHQAAAPSLNKNLFSTAHLGQRWAADHSPASHHLGTGLHPHYQAYQIKLCSVTDPFVCRCRAKSSPRQILHSIGIPASYLQQDTKATVIQHQWRKHQNLHGADADTQVFSPSTTQ